MLWGTVENDDSDATNTLIDSKTNSMFFSQLHAVLLYGNAFGGINIVGLELLSRSLELLCLAVMRSQPGLAAIDIALQNFEDYKRRKT